jgi:hypothetical protein
VPDQVCEKCVAQFRTYAFEREKVAYIEIEEVAGMLAVERGNKYFPA